MAEKAQLPTLKGPVLQAISDVIQPFAVKVGFDIATITGTTSAPHSGRFYWGTVTAVYPNVSQWVPYVREIQPDNSIQYRLTFTLTGIQQSAAQAYFGIVLLDNGQQTPELTWSQTALNPSGNDQVFFYDRVDPDFATVRDIAIRGSTQGWLLGSEWQEFGRLIYNTAWFNTVKWNDGR